MTLYDYVVARFVPDFVKDEPVNIGVIVYEKTKSETIGKFITDFTEIKVRNPTVNIKALEKILEGYRGIHKVESGDYLFRLVKDCSHSLYFKNVCAKDSPTPEAAMNQLYDEYVSIERKAIAA